MFGIGDYVDFIHGDEIRSGVISQIYEVPYATIVDYSGERFYVPLHKVSHIS